MHRCPACGHPIPIQELLTAADFVTFYCRDCGSALRLERRRYFRLVTLAVAVTLALAAAALRIHPSPGWLARALLVASILCALITIPLYRIEVEAEEGKAHTRE